MVNVDYLQFEGLSLPSTAVAGYKKGFFSKAQWAVYKHLVSRYNCTGETFFPCSDSYFKTLNLSRKTIQRVLKNFEGQNMIETNCRMLGESKHPVRHIALRYNFFYVNGFGTLEDVIKGKDRVIRKEREIGRQKDEVIKKQKKEYEEIIRQKNECIEQLLAIISDLSSSIENHTMQQRIAAAGLTAKLITLDKAKAIIGDIKFLDKRLEKINNTL